MDHADAFLEDIVAHPDDDAPRLVYADWLEDQDDPAGRARADFIRVQYALAELPPGDLRRVPLEQRQRDLLLAHEAEWTAGLRDLGVASWEFRRGFVERIRIHPLPLVRNANRIRARHPVRELCLVPSDGFENDYGVEESLAAVPSLPLLEQLCLLDVSEFDDRAKVLPLLRSPLLGRLEGLGVRAEHVIRDRLSMLSFLPRLKSLRFHQWDSGNGDAEFFQGGCFSSLRRLELMDRGGANAELVAALVSSPHLQGLEELLLMKVRFSVDGLEHLAAGRLPHLRRLEITGSDLTPTALKHLLGGPLLETAEVLDLSSNKLGRGGNTAAFLLAKTDRLPRLRRLVLNGNGFGGAYALGYGGGLAALESLHLRTNPLQDRGFRDLVYSLPGLRELNVSYASLTWQGTDSLARSWPAGLEVLDLSWNHLGDQGVQALAACPHLHSLKALDLSYCEVGDGGATALAGCPGLGNLATLNLATNRVGDQGLAALARSPHLGALRSLHLGNSLVGDDGVRALLDSPLLGRLEVLHLGGTAVTPALRQEVRSAFRGILG